MEALTDYLIKISQENGNSLTPDDIDNLRYCSCEMLQDMIIEAEKSSVENRFEWNNCLIVAIFRSIGIDISLDTASIVRQNLLSAIISVEDCLNKNVIDGMELDQIIMSGEPLPDEVVALVAYLFKTKIVVSSAGTERSFFDMTIDLGVSRVSLIRDGFWEMFEHGSRFFQLQIEEIVRENGGHVPACIYIDHSYCHYTVGQDPTVNDEEIARILSQEINA